MYSFPSRVRYSECDERGDLSLVGLVNYLQDCSIFHTESIGLGIDFMASRHFAWLIAAWQIQIGRLPRFNEEIVVGTWCYHMTRTMAQRNFSVCTPDGTPYVQADSLWLTFDTEQSRPVRIPKSEYAYLTDEPRIDMPATERKIVADGPYTRAESFVVTTQHLDTNHHVNNAQYIHIASEAVGKPLDPRRICVQYRTQARLGDVIEPRIHGGGGTWTVDLSSPEGKTYAMVRFEA